MVTRLYKWGKYSQPERLHLHRPLFWFAMLCQSKWTNVHVVRPYAPHVVKTPSLGDLAKVCSESKQSQTHRFHASIFLLLTRIHSTHIPGGGESCVFCHFLKSFWARLWPLGTQRAHCADGRWRQGLCCRNRLRGSYRGFSFCDWESCRRRNLLIQLLPNISRFTEGRKSNWPYEDTFCINKLVGVFTDLFFFFSNYAPLRWQT